MITLLTRHRALVLFVLLVAVRSAPAVSLQRPGAVSLDGTWEFRFAPDNQGVKESWFSPEAKFDRNLAVPGCWDTLGVGEPTDKMRHNAIGVGWYRRAVRLPEDWKGRRVWLTVGGAHRSVTVWVNGKRCGEHVGYPVAYRLDITSALKPGAEQSIVLAVDSRRDAQRDSLTGAFDIIDFMDLTWGGIFESVWLEATDDVWIDDAFAQPDPTQRSATFEIKLGKSGTPPAPGTVAIAVRPADAASGPEPLAQIEKPITPDATSMRIEMKLPGAPLWSPDSPKMLIVNISLKRDQQVIDRCNIRFGLRKVTIDKSQFFLNGDRFFLRGYGDDYTFPLEIAPAPDVAYWKAYLQKRKAFGFNGNRHHSTMMNEAYLTAADEVGVFVQPELPIAYDPFFQSATPAGRQLYLDVLRDYVRQMRNHPSVFAWCMGNEEWNGFALGPDLVALARSLDPTRPVIDTDGVPPNANRPTMDYLPVQFNEGTLPWGNARKKYDMASAPKPVIVHEMGNISVLPDPADIPLYNGVIKPFWLEQMNDAVKKQGLEPLLGRMLGASRKLQASLLKLNIESARLSPAIAGYDQWLFRDYWTQSTGFVNQFDQARAMTPEMALAFNGAVTVLWDRNRVDLRSEELVPIRLFVSDFRPKSEGELGAVTVHLGEREITLEPPKTKETRGLIGPWTGELTVSRVDHPVRLTLEAHAGAACNSWPIWVYPEPAAAPGGIVVTRRLNRAVLERLEAGAKVLLTDPSSMFPTLPAAYKPSWWKGDESHDHTYGTLFTDHTALKEFKTDGYGDLNTFRMLDQRPVVMLDELPVRIEPIVWSIDVPWRMRRKAYLFEAKVGAGSLLVSTFNLSEKTREQSPAAAWLLSCLKHYVASAEFQPKVELPAAWLRERIGSEGLPDVATWVEGYAGGAKTTEEPARWYSDREDDVLTYPIRQTDGKQRLEWKTAAVPEHWAHPTVTFAWAGGIGWQSQPGGGHFSLKIDGQPVLDFPFTRTASHTSSPDGRSQLTYVVRRTMPEDTFGLFLLTVPADRVPRGKAVTIELSATAQNSRRWVSLVPYTNVVATETEGEQ